MLSRWVLLVSFHWYGTGIVCVAKPRDREFLSIEMKGSSRKPTRVSTLSHSYVIFRHCRSWILIGDRCTQIIMVNTKQHSLAAIHTHLKNTPHMNHTLNNSSHHHNICLSTQRGGIYVLDLPNTYKRDPTVVLSSWCVSSLNSVPKSPFWMGKIRVAFEPCKGNTTKTHSRHTTT